MTPGERLATANQRCVEHALPQRVDVGGRVLAVLEQGDPEGFPVFYAHGNPGSRLELLYFDEVARLKGFRLITFDRPGFGGSDFVSPYDLHSFANDVATVAASKGIARYGLLGWSSGAPPVIATTYYQPEAVAFTFAIAGYTDFSRFPDAINFMKSRGFPGASLSKQHPLIFTSILKMMRWADLYRPQTYYREATRLMPASDRRFLSSPGPADLFIRGQQEALIQGTRGSEQDLQVQWQYWGFEMADVTAPVVVIQGEQDSFVPREFPEHIARQLSNASLVMIPEKGHLLPLDRAFQDQLFDNARHLINGQSNHTLHWNLPH